MHAGADTGPDRTRPRWRPSRGLVQGLILGALGVFDDRFITWFIAWKVLRLFWWLLVMIERIIIRILRGIAAVWTWLFVGDG